VSLAVRFAQPEAAFRARACKDSGKLSEEGRIMAEQKRILVVAHQTAATPLLLGEVRRRAQEEGCKFDLLIPDVTDETEAKQTLDLALPLLQEASGKPVEGLTGGPEPLPTIQEKVRSGNYDEVIVSTLPRSSSRWLGRDLPRRVLELGVPVTVVTAAGARSEAELGPALLPGMPGLSR
jgi:hypothetical protein